MSQVKGLLVMDVDSTLVQEEVIDLLGEEEVSANKSLKSQSVPCVANWILDRLSMSV